MNNGILQRWEQVHTRLAIMHIRAIQLLRASEFGPVTFEAAIAEERAHLKRQLRNRRYFRRALS